MADEIQFSDFTPGEKASIAALVARMTLPRADLRKLQRKVEQIEKRAARRKGE
ncbi:DUF6257 family protein [Streptomyces leeuwenhoekii]|uniref:DUF6257 family protein n=1 Tax=Streptomyces leeuwenhoekii TaxID=1437453 RepID=UPI000AF9F666|nr:DUF6257 family protein [Streptomyces leeuwenhoekii]